MRIVPIFRHKHNFNMKNTSFDSKMEDEEEEKDGINVVDSKTIKEIPRHPKWCPECLGKGQRSKVKIFSLNEDGEAIYMCSNMKVRQDDKAISFD